MSDTQGSMGGETQNQDRLKETIDRVAENAHRTVDRLAQTAGQAEQTLRGSASQYEHQLRDMGVRAQDTATENLDEVRLYMQQHPFASAGIAFAAGLVMSAMLRR